MTDLALLKRCVNPSASVDDLAELLVQEYTASENVDVLTETDSFWARLLALDEIASRLAARVRSAVPSE
jgi:hypothetical protein